MDDIQRKVLLSTKSFLERLTQSDMLSADQMTEAHMAVTALGYQLTRDAYDPARLASVLESEQALVRALSPALNEGEGEGDCAAFTRVWQERWDTQPGAALATLIAGGHALSTETEQQVARQVRDFLVDYHQPMDPAIAAGTRSTYQGGRGDVQASEDSGAIYITAPALQAYMRDRFPDQADMVVRDVKRLMGGYSKETYIVTFDVGRGEDRIVIRKDGYGLPTGSSVSFEYGVLKEVHALGLPVPEPLWLETDPAHFSASYMAVGFLPGTPAHLTLPTDAATRALWCDNLADVLARLHNGTSKPDADIRTVIRDDIADLQRRIEERERAPHPGLTLGMTWLVDHLDDLKGRPACRIHGDVGFHNILMKGNDILALLDWEYSHYSDPIEDLVYVKPFLDQIDGWDRFLATYLDACGFTFDDTAARYFKVWKEVRNLVACLGSLNSLLLPQVKDVALSVAGTIYIPKYEIAVLDAILLGD